MNKWPKHWVFWLGPILGGLGASYLHRYILKRDGGIIGKKRRNGLENDGNGIRELASDGVSLDIPPTELLSNVGGPDRKFSLICTFFQDHVSFYSMLFIYKMQPIKQFVCEVVKCICKYV